jgi:hypothetical protein
VFDGSVTFNNQGYPFRAYIDLANPANSKVFVTTTNVEQPTATQTAALTTLNNKVTAAGGILESPTSESPDTGSAPDTGSVPTTGGPVHAGTSPTPPATTGSPDTGSTHQH